MCGAVVSDRGAFSFTRPGDMLDYLVSREMRNTWHFAHNLEYDLGVLTGGDLHYFTCLFTHSRLLWAETQDQHGHKWRLCDSANIFVGSTVKQLGEMTGLAKGELHPVVERHLRAGRPLSELEPDDQHRVLSYNLRDAEIVYVALMQLQEELLELGGQLQPTIAGISMDLFRRKYLREAWPTPDEGTNNIARQAYYGARTEPYRLGIVENVSGYDISSLYPSVQAAAQFPDPDHLTWELGLSPDRLPLHKPGISQVRLAISDQAVPPLPARSGYHLVFPRGELSGVWPHNELQLAVENGATIRSVDWSLISTRTFNPFTTFIQELYARRVLAASSSPIRAQLFKLILNSAYGRYGLDWADGLQVLKPVASQEELEAYGEVELRMLGGWPYVLAQSSRPQQPAYSNVLIAAYVAAGARIRMHALISEHQAGLAYTDTDSLWTDTPVETGEGLGSLRQVHPPSRMWIVAPKEYAVYRCESLVEAHAKGVGRYNQEFYLLFGETAFESPVRIREGLLQGKAISTWINRIRQRHFQVPKRAPMQWRERQGEYWQTRPWEWQEYQAALRGQTLPPDREGFDPAQLWQDLSALAEKYRLRQAVKDASGT